VKASGRWYEFRAAADKSAAELFIYSDIGAFGVTASDFARDLKAVGRVKRIDLRINSAGGDVFQGNAIFNMLQRHPASIHVHVDGVAASMASLIAMVGDEVSMPRNAMMMIHDPMGGTLGTARDMRDMAEVLDKLRDGMVEGYAGKTGLSPDEIKGLMADETWMDAEEALALGFADSIEEPVAIAASVDLSKFKHPPSGRATKEAEMAKENVVETPEQIEARLRAELTASLTETITASVKREADDKAAADAAAAGKETPEQASARAVAEAKAKALEDNKQIIALCELAGRPSAATKFIVEGKSVAEVTAALAKDRADGVAEDKEVSARHGHSDKDNSAVGGGDGKGLSSASVFAKWNAPRGKRVAA
jgi:ATP-dependent Clp endopeptidase proteolytic subunit ClpP